MQTNTTHKRVTALGTLPVILLFFPELVHAQSWTKLANPFPGLQSDTALLLTDGTILVHDACSPVPLHICMEGWPGSAISGIKTKDQPSKMRGKD